MLESYIAEQIKAKPILLMTHLVLGYPSFEENLQAIQAMSKAEVELVELQIPFTEPVADGPVILKANCESIKRGTTFGQCLEFAARVCNQFPNIKFLIMTYYNIVFAHEELGFLHSFKAAGIQGFIIPDLPIEEAKPWMEACKQNQVDNILIFTPANTQKRLSEVAAQASGFIYSVGRRGVTGLDTEFDNELGQKIDQYRQATSLPLALGFGVASQKDIEFLTGKVEIAVIGSKLIKLHLSQGIKKVAEFLLTLR